jgi:hypothetical protein
MSLYDEMQPIASSLLKEFKQGVIRYIKVTPGNGSADNPGTSGETPFDLDGTSRGVMFKYVSMGLAVASDLQVTVNVIPEFAGKTEIRGFIEIDGVKYKIKQSIPKPAAGTAVVYTFIVGK